MRKNRTPHAWENEISSWFKRHETETITPELAARFSMFIFKKKTAWDLQLMREMVAMKEVIQGKI